MLDPKSLKKGDCVVYHNRVLEIARIDTDKKRDEKVLVGKNYFITQKGLATMYRIPFSSVENTNIRKLISKSKMMQVMRDVQTVEYEALEEKLSVVDVEYGRLELEEIIEMMVRLWDEKAVDPSKFATSRKLMLTRLIRTLSHIVGASLGIEREAAVERIEKRLDKREVKIPVEK